MSEVFFAVVSAIFLLIIGLITSLFKFAIANWVAILIAIVVFIFLKQIVEHVNSLNRKVDELESLLKKEINLAIDNRFNYSLTNIYNEKEMLGHEWTYKIDEGHWVTSIYDESSGKFIVKHFRTHQNTQENSFDKRMFEDMAHNNQHIYGDDRSIAKINGMEIHNGIYVPKK